VNVLAGAHEVVNLPLRDRKYVLGRHWSSHVVERI